MIDRPRPTGEAEQENYIISTPVSPERVRGFREEYIEDREKCAAVEAQFRRHRVLMRRPETSGAQAVGFNVLMLKGPFVEGSSWVPYRTWQFALAMERHIMARFEDRLRHATIGPEVRTVERTWRALFQEANRLASIPEWGDHYRTLIVLTGRFDVDMMVDLHRHAKPDWELPPDQNKTWVLGEYQGAPIIEIPESSESTMFIVDVTRLGFFTAYGDVEFELEEIDEGRAQQLLEANPSAVAVPEGLPDTRAERLRQLQLHVAVRLYERYEITVRDEGAVLKAAIAP